MGVLDTGWRCCRSTFIIQPKYCIAKKLLDQSLCLPAQGKGRARGCQLRSSGVALMAVTAGSGAEPAWPGAPGSAAKGHGLGRFCFPLSSLSHAGPPRQLSACAGIVPRHQTRCSCLATHSGDSPRGSGDGPRDSGDGPRGSGDGPRGSPAHHPCVGTQKMTISLWSNVVKWQFLHFLLNIGEILEP